jgi:hypothetical protein
MPELVRESRTSLQGSEKQQDCRHLQEISRRITQGRRDRNQATVAGPSNTEPSSSTGSTIVVDTGLPVNVPIPAAASIASRAGTVCYAKMSSNIY